MVAAVAGVVVLISLLILAAAGLGAPSAQALPLWLRNVQAGADIYQKVATPTALIVGGLFALYRLDMEKNRQEKERTYASRLQPAIEYEVGQVGDRVFLKASVSCSNIGNTRVDIASAFSGVQFYTRRSFDSTWWLQEVTGGVFEAQGWLEPGESIGQPVWFEIYKSDWIAIKIDFYAASSETSGWLASDICNLSTLDDNSTQGAHVEESTEPQRGFLSRIRKRVGRTW